MSNYNFNEDDYKMDMLDCEADRYEEEQLTLEEMNKTALDDYLAECDTEDLDDLFYDLGYWE